MKALVILLLILLLVVPSHGQDVISAGIDVEKGSIFVQSSAVQNTADGRPFMVQLSVDQQLTDSVAWQRYGCFPHHGLKASYTNFGTSVLGHAAGLIYYLEPVWRIGSHIELGFHGAGGFLYTSAPYDSIHHPQNLAYSWPVNPYIAIGLCGSVKLSRRLSLTMSYKVSHISNGAITRPNDGVNWITGGAGLRYHLTPLKFAPTYKRIPERKSIQTSLAFFYARPMYGLKERQRYTVQGLELMASLAGIFHGWTLGMELIEDHLYEENARRTQTLNHGPWLTTIAAGHEFRFPRFIFSQQIGTYTFYKPGDNYSASYYHRWGLVYYPIRKIGLGINLKIHKASANFIDARMVYTIRR